MTDSPALLTFVNLRATFEHGRAIQPQFSTASAFSSSLLVRAADSIPEPSDIFTFARRHVSAARTPRFSLFSLFAPKEKERNIRLFVFNHLHTLFHSLRKSETLSPFFSAISTLFAKMPDLYSGSEAFPARHQLASDLLVSRLWSLIINVFLSSHRYFRISFEKPYPQTYHPMAKRYRTGCILRVFGFQGFRVCFTSPEKSNLYLAALS